MISQVPVCLRSLVGILLATIVAGCASAPAPQAGAGSGAAAVQPPAVGSAASTAVSVAMQQLGVPYRYGGASPQGFDCSGLVHYAYARAGQSLPRTTATLWSGTRPVARDELQAGDILFFRISGKLSHVGLYIGDEQFVHAPESGRVVSVASLRSDFYKDALIRAGRPYR